MGAKAPVQDLWSYLITINNTMHVIKHTNKALNEHQRKFIYIHIDGGSYFSHAVHSSAFHSY